MANDLDGKYIHSNSGADLADLLRGTVVRDRIKTGTKFETILVDLTEPLLWLLLLLLAGIVIIKTP